MRKAKGRVVGLEVAEISCPVTWDKLLQLRCVYADTQDVLLVFSVSTRIPRILENHVMHSRMHARTHTHTHTHTLTHRGVLTD